MKCLMILAVLMGVLLFAPVRAHAQACGTPLLRVGLSETGEQPDCHVDDGDPSSGGTYVAFSSCASNILPGDDNGQKDVFSKHMPSGEVVLVSIAYHGGYTDRWSGSPRINCDGRFVVFDTPAPDLVEDDTNAKVDVFVRDVELGITTRVSVSSAGEEGNDESDFANISGDGRYAAFASRATNLVPDDTNGTRDVFVHDLWTAETTRVSVSSNGEEGNRMSATRGLSFDGRYVEVGSWADNLVPDDTNGKFDIFVHDRSTGQTTRVTVNAEGEEANGHSLRASISGNGRYVAIESKATNMVPDDTNGATDIFVVEWQIYPPRVERVSVSSTGEQANSSSFTPGISDDGRMVVFRSHATNLVPEGANGQGDIYVHDRLTRETKMVSTTVTGEWADNWSPTGRISCDGKYVTLVTDATNLIPADTNGYQDVYLRALEVPLLTPGDGDCDGDIDFADFAVVQRCFTLHFYDPPVGPECYALDFNFDGDVDRRDFAEYLAAFTGPR